MEGLGELPPELTAELDESTAFDIGVLEVAEGKTDAPLSLLSSPGSVNMKDGVASGPVLMLLNGFDVLVKVPLLFLIVSPSPLMRVLGLVPVPSFNAGAATAPVA